MAKGKEIPLISFNQNVKAALEEMSKKNLGMVCVKAKNGKISIWTTTPLTIPANKALAYNNDLN